MLVPASSLVGKTGFLRQSTDWEDFSEINCCIVLICSVVLLLLILVEGVHNFEFLQNPNPHLHSMTLEQFSSWWHFDLSSHCGVEHFWLLFSKMYSVDNYEAHASCDHFINYVYVCAMLISVPLEGDALTENKMSRIVDKLLPQTVNVGDIATFECRFASPVQPQVCCATAF